MKKYIVTKEFMDELAEWRDTLNIDPTSGDKVTYVMPQDLNAMLSLMSKWWVRDKNPIERNKRLIAIVSWLNGEKVFEVEEPHKFVVRSKEPDKDGDYWYVSYYRGSMHTNLYLSKATRFDTRKEAQEWANSHQVVIEVDEDGKEICINTL